MIQLAPSILSADFSRLGEDIQQLDEAGIDMLHIDVMDGQFVPNISFGVPIIKSIRHLTQATFDVHLMIEEPNRYLGDFVQAGADILTVHAESCRHLHRTVQAIKSLGVKAAVALNPATSLSMLDYVLDELDMVLLMSVNPGFGGQAFIEPVYDKIRQLKEKIEDRGLGTKIQVDGGIHLGNVERVIEAGASIIVAGSAIFNQDKKQQVKAFKTLLEDKEGMA